MVIQKLVPSFSFDGDSRFSWKWQRHYDMQQPDGEIFKILLKMAVSLWLNKKYHNESFTESWLSPYAAWEAAVHAHELIV